MHFPSGQSSLDRLYLKHSHHSAVVILNNIIQTMDSIVRIMTNDHWTKAPTLGTETLSSSC